MERLSRDGVARYDFLRGDSAFKRSLTGELTELVMLAATRLNLRVLLARGRHFGGRLRRRLQRAWQARGGREGRTSA